jgi:hypothetical protein
MMEAARTSENQFTSTSIHGAMYHKAIIVIDHCVVFRFHNQQPGLRCSSNNTLLVSRKA